MSLDPYEQFVLDRMNAGDSPKEICSRLMVVGCAPKCHYCEWPSTKLCDFRIARCVATMEELVCSTPMCSKHARTFGTAFYCGFPGGCQVDSEDFCPDHPQGSFGRRPDRLV